MAIHLTASKPGSITLKALFINEKFCTKNFITHKVDDHKFFGVIVKST